MWSLSLFTVVTIFMAVFNNMVSMAFLTFALSGSKKVSQSKVSSQRVGSLTTVCSWSCQRNIQRPLFPTNFLFTFCKPCLSSLFLKELNSNLTSYSTPSRTGIRVRVQLSHKSSSPLFYKSFDFHIFNDRQSNVQNISGSWTNTRKVAVEKDCMQDAFLVGD